MTFSETLAAHRMDLRPLGVDTLQVNLGKLCNQACRHCHVDAGPKRTEMMDRRTVERCLDILAAHPSITTLDLTGGAPELHEDFAWMVTETRRMGRRVLVRHNLTVTLDPHPLTGADMTHLPAFFREQGVEVVSSLPFFQEQETDRQRGQGVFARSIESMRRLNAIGYGADGSGLVLNLVHNPVGAFLPPSQPAIEAQFREELRKHHGLFFTNLFVITNMPINRFRHFLDRAGLLDEYMERLRTAFNPAAAEGVMCRSLLSVGYDGTLFDCDFNQMLNWRVNHGAPHTIHDFSLDRLSARRIVFGDHCFGCTAGAGSSCGGAVVKDA